MHYRHIAEGQMRYQT